jgi:hypothetical protein
MFSQLLDDCIFASQIGYELISQRPQNTGRSQFPSHNQVYIDFAPVLIAVLLYSFGGPMSTEKARQAAWEYKKLMQNRSVSD